MKKINIAEQSFNPFELIGKDWMLISAGTAEKWNTMTASWGGVGVMWGKPSAFRPAQRSCQSFYVLFSSPFTSSL